MGVAVIVVILMITATIVFTHTHTHTHTHTRVLEMHKRIAVVGAGSVGASICYALLLRRIAAELVLVDIDASRCAGEVADLTVCSVVGGGGWLGWWWGGSK